MTEALILFQKKNQFKKRKETMSMTDKEANYNYDKKKLVQRLYAGTINQEQYDSLIKTLAKKWGI